VKRENTLYCHLFSALPATWNHLTLPLKSPPHVRGMSHQTSAATTTEPANSQLVGSEEGPAQRYGPGNYALFRSLYKGLCEELKSELHTIPPPPFDVSGDEESRWQVSYHPSTNMLQFYRAAAVTPTATGTEKTGGEEPSTTTGAASSSTSSSLSFMNAAVVAYAKVEMKNPPRLNALLTFADWCPMEVLIQTGAGVILHFSIACNEGGMHMRNVRAYDAKMHVSRQEDAAEKRSMSGPAADEGDGAAAATDSGDTVAEGSSRALTLEEVLFPSSSQSDSSQPGAAAFESIRHMLYDGPCLWHLELDFQNELYDIMQDYGIHLDFVRWVSKWVFYYDHRLSVQWHSEVLMKLIPPALQGRASEDDFLTPEEKGKFDEPASDWIREPSS